MNVIVKELFKDGSTILAFYGKDKDGSERLFYGSPSKAVYGNSTCLVSVEDALKIWYGKEYQFNFNDFYRDKKGRKVYQALNRKTSDDRRFNAGVRGHDGSNA
ncbi:hypothetical protein [Selenomonas ruminantium]|uniref:hypothetical protein n=1 Tax=Selenomonas ruminantium TaxID=971 RepID=UPI0026EAB1F5|nr:hypothetical protein [Selenomonas ruminantium]